MLTITINSATQQTSVALLNGKKILSEKTWKSKKNEAEKILPAIQTQLKKAKQQWQNVQNIFVTTGPGPFTGLRVGVTIANALAFSTNSSITTTTVFEYLRERLPSNIRSKTAIIIKGGGEYMALILPESRKEKLLSFQKLSVVLKKTSIQYILAEMKPQDQTVLRKFFKTEKIPVQFIQEKALKTFGKTALKIFQKTKHRSKLVKPLYLQKPNITQSKKPDFSSMKK